MNDPGAARWQEELYELLPAELRIADAREGARLGPQDPGAEADGPLRALLRLAGRQADIVEENIAELWDDLFVETAADWVVPYIGELIGNVPIRGVSARRRADVAKTIGYRRRKGRLSVLEDIARQVTGWGAHAVAAYDLLQWSRHADHGRPVRIADVRSLLDLARVGGPFDQTAHTVDVRRPSRHEGWHGRSTILLFLWRLRAYPLRGVPARRATTPAAVTGFHLSPLGAPMPLFHRAEAVPDIDAGPTDERHVPGPLTFATLARHGPVFWGPGSGRSLHLRRAPGQPIPAAQIVTMSLATWTAPPPGRVGIDPVRARVAFRTGDPNVPATLESDHVYGFADDLGGGPYRRTAPGEGTPRLVPGDHASLAAALGALATPRAIVELVSNRTETSAAALSVNATGRSHVVVRAGAGVRPVIAANVHVTGTGGLGVVDLHGLVIAGEVQVVGPIRELRLTDCTIVPGRTLTETTGAPAQPAAASITVAQAAGRVRLVLERCITGPLRLPEAMDEAELEDSIVDAPDPSAAAIAGNASGTSAGPAATLRRVTVFGAVHVRELPLASESLFDGVLTVDRRQEGCARFCAMHAGSGTPDRYRCVEAEAVFTDRRYGRPAYAQLAPSTPAAIRTGAEDGSELGVFRRLRQPHRESDLRLRLDEYLPFGLEAGLIHVT